MRCSRAPRESSHRVAWEGRESRGIPCQMIPKICASCEQQQDYKLISLYWAWARADRTRVAWLQKVCRACFTEQVAPYASNAMEPVLMCPVCGIGTVDDYDTVWVTIYVPGMPKLDSEWPCCGPCAVAVRTRAMAGATQLPDRQSGSLGAASGPQPASAAATWEALGLRPR